MAKRERRLWTSEEDHKLIEVVGKYRNQTWEYIPERAGLIGRNDQSCWERWTNHLSPDAKRAKGAKFSRKDDETIIRLQPKGNRWTFIGTQLQPRRTGNDVKNHWYNHLKKEVEKRDRAIRDLDRPLPLLMDDGTSDHCVQEDELEIRNPEIRELGRQLFTDNGTSDHSVRGDELERLMAELESSIHHGPVQEDEVERLMAVLASLI